MTNSLDLSKTDEMRLIVRIAPSEFSYYISRYGATDGAVYVSFPLLRSRNVSLQIEEIFYQHELLRLPYKATYLISCSPNYSVVPNLFFQENKQENILQFLHKTNEEKIFSNSLKRMHVIHTFSIEKEIYSFLHRSLSINNVVHYTTILAEYFAQRSKFGDYSKMFVNIDEQRIDLYCFERNRLKLVNSFDYLHPSDATYFILNSWSKVTFNQVTDELLICGQISRVAAIEQQLKEYIARINYISPPTNWYAETSTEQFLPIDIKTFSLCE